MNPTTHLSLFQACDFCQTQGVLGRTILDRDGWYFCGPCVEEIDKELEKRRNERKEGQEEPQPA
ncbi:MAG TPA: hypothetical protein VHE12_01645 [bacterium]|nr:hypothetical protein [bacterium]